MNPEQKTLLTHSIIFPSASIARSLELNKLGVLSLTTVDGLLDPTGQSALDGSGIRTSGVNGLLDGLDLLGLQRGAQQVELVQARLDHRGGRGGAGGLEVVDGGDRGLDRLFELLQVLSGRLLGLLGRFSSGLKER